MRKLSWWDKTEAFVVVMLIATLIEMIILRG